VSVALARARGVVLVGVSGVVVDVEVEVANGLPSVGVVGLPDASVNESRWRTRSALTSVGAEWPQQRVTINLSPAEVPKLGSGLDLPIAVAVLAATKPDVIDPEILARTAFLGELALDGRLHGTRGDVLDILAGGEPDIGDPPVPAPPAHDSSTDLADVRGHAQARFALEVAAAGGHHLAMVGPPGIGKTMLAERLPGLLPALDDDAAIEVAAIHAVAGYPRDDDAFTRPPYRAPHHTASPASVLGSASARRVHPGAATLAHRGILFLDEAPEFPRGCLEGLRQPLESGSINLSRAAWSGLLPAAFQLILAANPCPCGHRSGSAAACTCAPAQIRRYASRLSGPLMDRIDVRMVLWRPADADLGAPGESSAVVRERVAQARERAARRFGDRPWRRNVDVPTPELRRWRPDAEATELLQRAERRASGLRGTDRVVRVAWTLADLAGRDRPGVDEVAAAIALRGSW
jgi:magnesium chelatase family protein